MTDPGDLARRITAIRHEFDAAFAAAPTGTPTATCDLLAIRVAGEPYVLRVQDIAELTRGRKIVKLPTRRPDVMGMAAIRGTLVSVHSLAQLLGHGHDDVRTPWLALCPDSGGIALAFGALERLLRVGAGEVPSDLDGAAGHLLGVVRIEGKARPVIDVHSIVAVLQTEVPAHGRNLT